MSKDRIVLAYSGGLDTSVAIGWVAEETGAADRRVGIKSRRRSDASLDDFNLATHAAQDTFGQTLAKGFVELWGMPGKLAATRDLRCAL